MSNDMITTSIGWRERESRRQHFGKVYKTRFGAMRGFIYRRSTGEYAAILYEEDDPYEGKRFSVRDFPDLEIAKKWIDVVIANWGRLFAMNGTEIEKAWVDTLKESS